MQQDAVSQILTTAGGAAEDDIEPFEDPFNWQGYIIQYNLGDGSLVSLLFTEEVSLSSGDSATLGTDAGFRSGQFIETSISGDTGGGDEASQPEDGGNATETDTESEAGATNETEDGGVSSEDVTVRTGDDNETNSS